MRSHSFISLASPLRLLRTLGSDAYRSSNAHLHTIGGRRNRTSSTPRKLPALSLGCTRSYLAPTAFSSRESKARHAIHLDICAGYT